MMHFGRQIVLQGIPVLVLLLYAAVPARAAEVKVSGTVSGPSGPVAGAAVRLRVLDTAVRQIPLAEAQVITGTDGAFERMLPTGWLEGHCIPPESAGLVGRSFSSYLDSDLRLRIKLDRAVRLSGGVAYVPSAREKLVIRAFSLTKSLYYGAFNSADGSFAFDAPADRYSIHAYLQTPCNECFGSHFSRVNVDARAGPLAGIVVPAPIEGQRIVPTTPPDASKISVSAPDADSVAVVRGAPGAVEGLSTVVVANLRTLQVNLGASEPDGSFSIPLFAPAGSPIAVKYDPTGRYLTRTQLGTANNDAWEVAPGTIITTPTAASMTGVPFSASSLLAAGGGHQDLSFDTVDVIGTQDPTRWSATGTLASTQWTPGQTVAIAGTMWIHSRNLQKISDLSAVKTGPSPQLVLERLFDEQGRQRQLSQQFLSSVMTPTGLPIERRGEILRGPLVSIDPWVRESDGRIRAAWRIEYRVPTDLPPGVYRPILTVYLEGVDHKPRYFDVFPFSDGGDGWYGGGPLPLVRVGNPAPPRLYWVLGMNDFSNGTRGTVALEDRDHFRTALHVVMESEQVIWPRDDPRTGARMTYRLEPFVPMISLADARLPAPQRVPFRFPSGKLRVRVVKPDGSIDDLGESPFVQNANGSPTTPAGISMSDASAHASDSLQLTTGNPRFDYVFPMYGRYRVEMSGTIDDIWGNSYSGGGTYEVIIAQPLLIESGVMVGAPFTIGDRFSPALKVSPAVPAAFDVRLRFADAKGAVSENLWHGQASRFGYFNAADAVRFSQPGEYRVDILATHADERGVWRSGAVTWGNVVESPNTSLVTHGRRGFDEVNRIQSQWFRVADARDGAGHVMYPFQSGDIQWMDKNDGAATIPKISVQDLGGAFAARVRAAVQQRNPRIEPPSLEERIVAGEIPLVSTSPTPYSPSTHPELIDQWGYFYAFAERPGIQIRALISEDHSPLGYWRFHEMFQRQAGVGINGDLPNDFKFLYGGAVYRDRDFSYFGAYASLFVLVFDPAKPLDGRLFPPFQGNGGGPSGGPLFKLKGKDVDLFFHSTAVNPGTILEVNQLASFVGQCAPTLPAKISIVVTSPSGRARTISGQANKIGYFYDPAQDFRVDEPGVWRAKVKVTLDGRTSAGQVEPPYPTGDVLGSREGEFYFYVVSRESPQLELAPMPRFVRPAEGPITFTIMPPSGLSNVEMHYTTMMPGFILEEGRTASLRYVYDAPKLARDFPNLDLFDADGFAGVDTITMSFLLSGTDASGARKHFARQIVLQGEELLVPDQTSPCQAGGGTLCVNRSRFDVKVRWRDSSGRSGVGRAVALTPDTGYFWFFGEENVELVIKVLDACGLAGFQSFWVFAAGLTNLETEITVTDTYTGLIKTYFNPLGQAFRPILDTEAFKSCAAGSAAVVRFSTPAWNEVLQEISDALALYAPNAAEASSSACTPGPTRLCLSGGRFSVEAFWRTSAGVEGLGQAVALTGDTGYFSFFDPNNIEVVIKVLNACTFPGSPRFWVFAAGLTNVEVRLRVTDTQTGEVKEYVNPLGTPFAPVQDTDAFATCP